MDYSGTKKLRQPRLTVFFSKQESPNLTLMYTVINDVLFRHFIEFNDSIYLYKSDIMFKNAYM